MKRLLGVSILAIALAAPASAQMMSASSMGGANALQYYVGTWSCMAGNVGETPSKATATYTMMSGLLHETVNVPPSGKMKTAYVASGSFIYDGKNHRYIETWIGNDAGWSVSYAKPWSGSTETWDDVQNSSGKLGRTVIVRTPNRFDFTGYTTIASSKPVFKGYCTR